MEPVKIALQDGPGYDYRYIWVSDNSDALAVDYTLNEVLSRRTTPIRFVKLKSEKGLVVRVSLSELGILPTLWDHLTFGEPYFTSFNTELKSKITVIPDMIKLIHLTGSKTPIVDHRWFQVLLNRDKYYLARGISRSSDKNLSDLDVFLKQFSGTTQSDVAKLRSDQKYAQLFSGVTGKPRAVLVYSGFGARPGVNQNLVMITQDVSDSDVTADKHPIRTLLDFKPTASEVIIEMNNGYHAFGLFNQRGELQNTVPPDIAKDHTIPEPYTAELVPRISCIRCHKSEGGIRSVRNDVQQLTTVLDILDKDIDRLAGLYSGSLAKPFERARADYSDGLVILKSQYNLLISPADHLVSVYNNYLYTRVDQLTVLSELGLPKDSIFRDTFKVPPNQLEDPIVGCLKAGLSISRLEFEQIYPDLLERILSQ